MAAACAPSVGAALDNAGPSELLVALVSAPLVGLAEQLNSALWGVEPWQIVAGTATLSLVVSYLYASTAYHRLPLTARIKRAFFRLMRRLPPVKKKLEEEKTKARKMFEDELQGPASGIPDLVELPDKGWDHEYILDQTKAYIAMGSMDWKSGAMSGAVYDGSAELAHLMSKVYELMAWTNPLHPDAFPGLRKMEAEIVRMSCELFQGGPDSCGCVTTGGTESIILACKAYRELARERGNEYPEILCAVTAHAAFDKAAEMLGMTIRHVPVDQSTMRVDVKAMRRMISSRTALLVGSAPQFPHGCIDPIESIGELGLKYNIPVHVDSCLGGFLVVFMKEAGYPISGFDFSVPGVTSISADTHKYGYAPKGTSVLLYRESRYRDHQWFTYTDWPGGIYATPTVGGSRAGGVIAACWAAMLSFGRERYVSITRDIVATTRQLADQLASTPGLRIVGVPEVSVVAFDSDQFNIYGLADGMKERGWSLNSLQFPICVHFCVTRLHTLPGVADRFIKDVREITADIIKNPEKCKAGTAAMYGMAASMPDRSVVGEVTGLYLDALYSTRAAQPKGAKTNGHAATNGSCASE